MIPSKKNESATDGLIHPIDYRYLVPELVGFLSNQATLAYRLKVEAAHARAFARFGLCSKEVAEEITKKATTEFVSSKEVDEKERELKHDIRAMVEVLGAQLSEEAKPFRHLGMTSFDVVNTAQTLAIKDCTKKAVIPALVALEKTLIKIARREKETVQIGRTHGQHAEPITFGFYISNFVDRFGRGMLNINNASEALTGKVAGAVGTKAPFALFEADADALEKAVLDELGLKPAPVSTQIVPGEELANYFSQVTICFATLADLANDMRNLQRTEIAEVFEGFSDKQVGSSTMPQKRNPISWENIISQFKAVKPHIISVYDDIISEHQRDLTNSASAKYYIPEFINAFVYSVKRATSVLEKLEIDRESMKRNFDSNKGFVLAEPLYILLAKNGHPDAHEFVRRIVVFARENNLSFTEALAENSESRQFIDSLPEKHRAIFSSPQKYVGVSVEKTEEIALFWESRLAGLNKELF
ncbi:MAG: adenylosuccinate lyase [Candidatus Diapherotrites archaeon]|nr:adenylosuccinate lyase [Candidatus Diapherotrites archaeon]